MKNIILFFSVLLAIYSAQNHAEQPELLELKLHTRTLLGVDPAFGGKVYAANPIATGGSHPIAQWRWHDDKTIRWAQDESVCLQYEGGITQSGTPLLLRDCATTLPVKWDIVANERQPRFFSVKPERASGLCIDVPNEQGHRVHLWQCDESNTNQQINAASNQPLSAFNLINKRISLHGRCLHSPTPAFGGENVYAVPCDTSDWQQWQFLPDNTIRNVHNKDYCLALENEHVDNGTRIVTALCEANNNFQWQVTQQAFTSESVAITPLHHPDKCMDVPNEQSHPVQLWACSASNSNQYVNLDDPISIAFVGQTNSMTLDGLKWQLGESGYRLAEPGVAHISPFNDHEQGECQINISSKTSAGETASVEHATLVCVKQLAGSVMLTHTAIYGGCDLRFHEATSCELGLFESELSVELGNGVENTYTFTGPSAEYCTELSPQRLCLGSGANLAEASTSVRDQHGNSVSAGVSIGVGAGYEPRFEDGVFSNSFEIALGVGISIEYSINTKTVYHVGKAGYMEARDGTIALGTAIADVYGHQLPNAIVAITDTASDLGSSVVREIGSFIRRLF